MYLRSEQAHSCLSLTLRHIFFRINCEAVLTIIQIVQSHFALAGQRKHYPSRTLSHSVMALQRRSSGTSSHVLLRRQVYTNTLSSV